jgi:hypothetical protein
VGPSDHPARRSAHAAKQPAAGYMPPQAYQLALLQSGLVISVSAQAQEQAQEQVRIEGLGFHTRSYQHAPDQAASHISLVADPPREDQHSGPASATAPSAWAILSEDNTGPVAVAVAAEHYWVLGAVLSARDMRLLRDTGLLRDIGSARDIVAASCAEAWRPRIRTSRSVCGRGNDSFFGRQSGDDGGGVVRVLPLLLRGVRALLCAWSVRGGGSLRLRVRGRRR